VVAVVAFVGGATCMAYLAQGAVPTFVAMVRIEHMTEQHARAACALRRGDDAEAARYYADFADTTTGSPYLARAIEAWTPSFPVDALVLARIGRAFIDPAAPLVDERRARAALARVLETTGHREEADLQYESLARLMNWSPEFVRRYAESVVSTEREIGIGDAYPLGWAPCDTDRADAR
jgi:hypothetical protein